MARLAALLACLASPAPAWEFQSTPFCALKHETEKGLIVLVYDHTTDAYAIALTLNEGRWDAAEEFNMVFLGKTPLTIGTDRHQITHEGRSLQVSDKGFGNVLDGLEFNGFGFGKSGNTVLEFGLKDAAPVVRQFRNCSETISS